MKALYRRYRPKTLSEVVGQEQITTILSNSIKNNNLAHAYLFIGPRGTGKTSVARILAHEVNGFKYELEDDYLDIIEIDAASNTGVDNIRDLREKAIIAPAKGKYKVYIIDEVHMLSKSAFNALLKTLEEPPEHVIFIMATTDAYKVPVTITSRSQTFTFKLADPNTMFEHLKKIATAEKIKIDDAALKIIVKRGGGSFRDSLSLLDQISTISDDLIDEALITKALGLPQQEATTNLLNAYAAADIARIRAGLQDLLDSGVKPEIIADNLISEIIANPQPVHLGLLDTLTDVSRSAYPNVKLLLALCNRNTPTVAPAQPAVAAPTPAPAPTPKPSPQPVTPVKPAPKVEAPKAETPKTEAPKAEPAPAATSATTLAPVKISSDANATEVWTQLLAHVQANAPSIHKMLQNSDYTLANNQLTIYARKKFNKLQIEKKRAVMGEVLPANVEIEVNDQTLNQDANIAAIADIMGGGEEVQIDE